MSQTITSDNGVEITVGLLALEVTDPVSAIGVYARLSPGQRCALADALRGREPGDEYVDWKAMYEQAVQERDALNTHHPKPQPYDQGGVRGVDSLLYRAERAERERDAAVARAAQLEKEVGKWRTATESAHSDFLQAAHERDEWKARAEAAEARTAPAVTCEHRDAVADHLWNAMVGSAKSVVRDVVAQAFVAAGIEVAVEAEAAADPVVIFMRESDLPAARVDGDYYVVASAKGDYKWPQHGPSWWVGRAQDALAEAARYTALARLAAAREAVVDPVEEKAIELHQVAYGGRIGFGHATLNAQEMFRSLARHVLGQEATR